MNGDVTSQEIQPSEERVSYRPALMALENIVIFMLSPQNDIERIIKSLEGYTQVFDDRGIPTYKKLDGSTSRMNQAGIIEVRRILNSYINTNVYLSNFTEREIYKNCEALEYELNDLFYQKWQDFGMEKNSLSLTVRSIMIQVHASLNKALQFRKEGGFGMMLQALTQQVRVKETTIKSPEKKGVFSIFGKGGKQW